ncbi:hypothetical protein PVAP13_8KG282900 [Panicum virgatum]|uniref:Uncharacterized protein n=1 Tax=Panicum virgatum TaxID=38727 RepID=A0A8T0PUB2_PANVG|nr:hypothetical protein PVAP13_8KG282900 [Panicum virgatum]
MLPAPATAAAPDPSCSPAFPSARRAPPSSALASRRATASPGPSLCRCHARWGNGRARLGGVGAGRVRHCRAVASAPDHMDELPARGRYHPFEDIPEAARLDDGEPAHLTDAESARTIVEVNSKATVMISTLVGDGVHERIILPEFPYLTDENGDIYFEVDNEDALLESIMGEDKIAVFADLDLAAASATDFAREDDNDDDEDDDGSDDDEESDFEDDFNNVEGVFALDDEDDDDDEDDEDDDLPSWSNLETVNSCHPLYFARMIVETATKSNIDWLDRPPASLVVEGQLRPAFAEESTMVAKHLSSDEPQKDKKESGATFFKVEVLSIELITAYGTEPKVKIEEYRKARPDIIAHSAPNIISRLRAGGDKITQALKSLCWRCKAIQVEEAAVIGVDCLGFDLRVCSGTQVQTLRFAFPTKATSEFSAEKQIHELLFPRNTHQEGQSPQARHKY